MLSLLSKSTTVRTLRLSAAVVRKTYFEIEHSVPLLEHLQVLAVTGGVSFHELAACLTRIALSHPLLSRVTVISDQPLTRPTHLPESVRFEWLPDVFDSEHLSSYDHQ